ncbi:unnamed protein product, partial [Tetraodon nigroviridis]
SQWTLWCAYLKTSMWTRHLVLRGRNWNLPSLLCGYMCTCVEPRGASQALRPQDWLQQSPHSSSQLVLPHLSLKGLARPFLFPCGWLWGQPLQACQSQAPLCVCVCVCVYINTHLLPKHHVKCQTCINGEMGPCVGGLPPGNSEQV